MTTKVKSSTLSDTGVSATSYGSTTTISTFTVDSTGRITTASSVTPSIATTLLTGTITNAQLAGSIAGTKLLNDTVSSTQMTTTGVVGAPYGGASVIPTFTVDTKGRITYAANVTPSIATTQLTGTISDSQIADVATTKLTGTISNAQLASGIDASKLTTGTLPSARLSATTVVAGTYGSATKIPTISVDSAGRLTAASETSVTFTTIADDNTTNATRYINFTSATSGSLSTIGTATSKLTFNPSSGVVGATNFTASSDEKLKTDIATVTNALATVNSLRGVTFSWKENGLKSMGVIAQEVEQILPELVTEVDGTKKVYYDNFVGLLIEAVKELSSRVAYLEGKLDK
jgi:hypothetical protein